MENTILKFFYLIIFSQVALSSILIHNSLVFQYFTEIHPVQHLILFSNKHFELNSFQKFMSKGIFILQGHNNDTQFEDFFHPVNIPVGVYVESEHRVLEWASEQKYFNSSYFWLIEGSDHENLETVLGKLFHIQLNSQITFVEKINSNQWNLIDVFSYGRHLRYELVMTPYAEWNSIDEKITITKEFPLMYRKNYRGDFQGLVMRQAIVVTFYYNFAH
jgi:hypothetical protein